MGNIDDSIEQLTAALQQLTAELAEPPPAERQEPAGCLPANQLRLSEGVESFVARSREYADKTRAISVGTY